VRDQVTSDAPGEAIALLPSSVGEFRIAVVVDEAGITVKTVMPPKRSRL